MLYSFLLAFHSFWRWVVLLTLVLSISRAFLGKKGHRSFSKKDHQLSLLTLISAHIQLFVGVLLWCLFGMAATGGLITYFVGRPALFLSVQSISWWCCC